MIEQNVQVTRLDDTHIWVRLGGAPGCSVCDNGKGCGAGVFAKLLRRKPVTLELQRKTIDRRNRDVFAGQLVTLVIPDKIYMMLVFNHYGWPLLAALAGAFGGFQAAVWLEVGTVLVDAFTITGSLLAGFLAMRRIKNTFNADSVISSLNLTVNSSSLNVSECGNPVENLDRV